MTPPLLVAAGPFVQTETYPKPGRRVVLLFWPAKTEFSVHDEVTDFSGNQHLDNGDWFGRIEDAASTWLDRVTERLADAAPGAIVPRFIYTEATR